MNNLRIRIEIWDEKTPKKIHSLNHIISGTQLKWCRDPYTVFQFQFDKLGKELWMALKLEGIINDLA
jgi:hypothetical protein